MLVVVSPHFDDAVFGCGALLAANGGSTVVTVLAAAPADAGVQTDWDRLCGFASAAEAIAARRREDEAALAVVGAVPRWLGFVDGQYGAPASETDVATALGEVLVGLGATRVFLPLGLFHADHRLVHGAAVRAVQLAPHLDAWLYEDAIYRAMPGVLDARIAELGDRVEPMPTAFPTGTDEAALKARAVRCYASQAPALGTSGMADAARPERFWRLRR